MSLKKIGHNTFCLIVGLGLTVKDVRPLRAVGGAIEQLGNQGLAWIYAEEYAAFHSNQEIDSRMETE